VTGRGVEKERVTGEGRERVARIEDAAKTVVDFQFT